MRVLLILLLLWVTPALAQQVLGNHTDWGLYSYSDSGDNTCTLSSQPKKSEGKYTRRGEVFFHVTARASRDWQHDVSVSMGYPVKGGTEVAVSIDGGKPYNFYVDPSQAEHAFLNARQTEAFLKNMQAGSRMVIRATSERGTATTDRFSLSGVTAGLNNMQSQCK